MLRYNMLRYRASLRWRVLGAVLFCPATVGVLVWFHIHGADHILTGWLLTLIGPVGWAIGMALAFVLPLLLLRNALRVSRGAREAAALTPNGLRFNALRHPGFIAWNEIAGIGLTQTRVRRRTYHALEVQLTPEARRARGMLPGSGRLSLPVTVLEQDLAAVAGWAEDARRWRRLYAHASMSSGPASAAATGLGRKRV